MGTAVIAVLIGEVNWMFSSVVTDDLFRLVELLIVCIIYLNLKVKYVGLVISGNVNGYEIRYTYNERQVFVSSGHSIPV